MKFVDVNPYFFPFKGGIEHRMHDTAKLLVERGHDVTILTSRLPNTEEEEITEDGYRIVRLESRFIDIYNPPIVFTSGVLEALESMDADVVNYNYRWANSYSKALKKYNGKKIFTYHNMWGEGMGLIGTISNINDNMFKKTLDGFDRIVCVSNFVKNDLISRGIPSDDIAMIPSCLTSFPVMSDEEGDFILSLGRLVETKGIKYLVEAMQRVKCKLIICGKGPEENNLKKQIYDLGLNNRIEMKGYVSEEEKAHLMSTCKFFVMPSLFESLGLAAIELMSYGRPIVSTDVNGLPETVGKAGIMVPSKDPIALAYAINGLLDDDEKRISMRSIARSQAETYDWKFHIEDLESLLTDVASSDDE